MIFFQQLILDKGCEGILPQGKGIYNWQKLRKVVAIYKTDKLILSKNYLSLKTRGSEKVPYSKNGCSKLTFLTNQFHILVSIWAVIL